MDAQRVKVHMASLWPPFKMHKKHVICAGHAGIGVNINHTLSVMNKTSGVVQAREQATTPLTSTSYLKLHSFHSFIWPHRGKCDH